MTSLRRSPRNQNMALSTEQFQTLMNAFMQANKSSGSFSTCTARYNGERNSAKVEEFISAISTFKMVEKIKDADAILGMPMLLTDEASEWWQGVKNNAVSFENVTKMLRDAFAPQKPAWRIYAEIMEVKQQRNEPTDSFIRKKRVLFAQLSSSPSETMQLDIVFGMLHSTIREKISRSKISRFNELLEVAREAELTLAERSTSVNTEAVANSGPVRCTFCRKKGHTIDKCFKKQNQQNVVVPKTAHAEKPTIVCYGCKTPGYIRANCPNCPRRSNSNGGVANFNSVSMSPTIGSDIPTVNVLLFGVPGQAYFDTAARTSVASSNLKRIMDMQNCKYKQIECEVTLADGSRSYQKCLETICKILVAGRTLDIKFMILPNAERNRTLLGVDFLEQAGITINLGQKYWSFEDDPANKIEFAEPWPLKINLIESIRVGESKRKPDEELRNEPKQTCNEAVYVSEFESYGPEIPDDRYDPKEIQAIFEDCLPIGMCTPQPHPQSHLFTGVVYKGKRRQPVNIELNMVEWKIIKETDAINLPENQKLALDELLNDHQEIFGPSDEPCPYAEHAINTQNHAPIASPPYRLSFNKSVELKAEIEKLLEMGIIEECESAWASPVVMVPKKGGGLRVCVDYRKLNAVTVADKYPLPRMDDLLHAAKSTKFMSTLDLQSGYYQIKIKEEDADKTCCTTPFGLYRFTRMPFGLRNAPATFQRLIDRFKAGIPNVNILAYLDDIIICSPSFETHLADLNKVFEKLKIYKLRLNNKKCRFCCNEIKYLGHILTPAGISVDPEKTQAIENRKNPRNLKELISFLQCCSWYRKFIGNFANIAKPLTELTKKNKVWIWGEIQQMAFKKLKSALTSSPILKQAQDGQPFAIKTDASAYALGAVLLQGEENDEHPIEFASRLLSKAEINYSTTEREALAIVWACAKFRGYIEGAEITLATDHQPLKWLLSVKSPTGRIARWALQIQQYNFKIEYLPGKANVVADMLSRPPADEPQVEVLAFQIDFPRRSLTELREEQLKDEYIENIIKSIETADENIHRWVNRGYILNDGVLYCYNNDAMEEAQLVVPKQDVLKILETYHDNSTAGHYGIERTIARIASRYYWPKMRADITNHVKKCIDCQRYKASNLKPAGLLQTSSSKSRFEILAVDLFGPLPKTHEGFQWILIAEDVASRWVELFPLKEATAEICAKTLIEEVFMRFGIPRRMKTDNGIQFISAIMQQVTYCLNINQQFTPMYHPEANPVERKNRDMKAQLAILVQSHHNTWNTQLHAIRFAMNTAKCESTGYSAAFLTFGRELRTLDDVQHDVKSILQKENFIPQITQYLHELTHTLENARENEQQVQDKNQKYTNQHRRSQNFDIGAEVLINTHVLSQAAKGITAKFVPKRDGPYTITKRIGATTYEVAAKNNPGIPLGTFHTSALTPYRSVDDTNTNTTPMYPIRKRGRPRHNKNVGAILGQ